MIQYLKKGRCPIWVGPGSQGGDPQGWVPVAWCPVCGKEIFSGTRCPHCQEEKEEEFV